MRNVILLCTLVLGLLATAFAAPSPVPSRNSTSASLSQLLWTEEGINSLFQDDDTPRSRSSANKRLTLNVFNIGQFIPPSKTANGLLTFAVDEAALARAGFPKKFVAALKETVDAVNEFSMDTERAIVKQNKDGSFQDRGYCDNKCVAERLKRCWDRIWGLITKLAPKNLIKNSPSAIKAIPDLVIKYVNRPVGALGFGTALTVAVGTVMTGPFALAIISMVIVPAVTYALAVSVTACLA